MIAWTIKTWYPRAYGVDVAGMHGLSIDIELHAAGDDAFPDLGGVCEVRAGLGGIHPIH